MDDIWLRVPGKPLTQRLPCYGGPFDGKGMDMRDKEREFVTRDGGVYRRVTAEKAARMGLLKWRLDLHPLSHLIVDVMVFEPKAMSNA